MREQLETMHISLPGVLPLVLFARLRDFDRKAFRGKPLSDGGDDAGSDRRGFLRG
jgi:hypothetical protein